MEKITFKNYKNEVTKTALNKAEKLKVRDFDETDPNYFVAYVDEGADSFDVSVRIIGKDEIGLMNCDCESKSKICIHKVAFLNHLAQGKTTVKVKTLKKRKLTPTEILLEEVDANDLKIWFQELINKNKDIEFLFVNEFSKATVSYDKEQVETIINNSIQSIVKNKKGIDNSELKKILEVLELVLKPVIAYCKDNLVKIETHDLLFVIYDELQKFDDRITLKTVKIVRLIEKIYKDIINNIEVISIESTWKTILDYYIGNLDLKRTHEFNHRLNNAIYFYETIVDEKRKILFSENLTKVFKQYSKSQEEFIRFALKVFSENKHFINVYQDFSSIMYANEYNLLLIEKLIEINKLSAAEQIAENSILVIYADNMKIPYWEALERIYLLVGNTEKLYYINYKLVFVDFKFERFVKIKEQISPVEFKKFRTKLLTTAKNSSYRNEPAIKLYLDIYKSENNYKQILSNINYRTPYYIVFEHKEELFLTDRKEFLKVISMIENSYYSSKTLNEDYSLKMANWVLEKYDPIYLKSFLEQFSKYTYNSFLKRIQENL